MSGFLLVAACLAQAATVIQPPPSEPIVGRASIDEGLVVEGETIAVSSVSNRLTIAVGIDATGPYRFIVDTGADRSVVGFQLAERLHLAAGPAARVHGVAGVQNVPMVQVGRLSFGTTILNDLSIPSLPERYLGGDGILGLDAVGDQRVLLDYQKRSITIQSAHRPDTGSGDDIVVTARRRHGQLILAEVEIDGIAVDAVIDSGSEVTIGNAALAAKLLRRRFAPIPPQPVTSVTGQVLQVSGLQIPELSIGRSVVHDLRMVFADAPPFTMFGLSARPAILLGSDVLRQFRRISLDFRRHRVRFVLK